MLTITYHGIKKSILACEKKSILKLVRENFECSFSSCAKTGSCGKCICYVRSLKPSEQAVEGECSKAQLLESGYERYKACQVIAKDGMDVVCDFVEDYRDRTKIIIHSTASGAYTKSTAEPLEGIIVDLGSTTIAMTDGVNSHAFLNPQRSYGSDVISRMEASNQGNAEFIKELTLNKIAEGLSILDNDKNYTRVYIAGNTSMIHLLMGYSCKRMSDYPFEPYSLKSEEFIFDGRCFKTVPGISAFVGGDIVSGLYFIEENYRGNKNYSRQNDENYLFIDLGTNGEIALKTKEGFVCTSAAAGPAFEGNVTANVPGSDLIHIVANCLRNGIIDETGLLADEFFDKGYTAREGVLLTQKAIRDLQLAKAAVACGVNMLLHEAKLSAADVHAVYIAGGFGYYLKPEDAFEIKLLPKSFEGKVVAVGNASLNGTLLAVKNNAFASLNEIVNKSRTIVMSNLDFFGDEYIKQLDFQV